MSATAALFLLLAVLPAAVAEPTPTIRSVSIDVIDVFDPDVPGEDWWPFRVANRIHIQTKDKIVKRELLLLEGDSWNKLKALESERNLRAYGSFRSVEISSSPRADGGADLLVRTQDSWTLNARLSVGTEGGDNFFIYGLEEGNLLGWGKQVGYFHSQIGPKIRNDLRYTDPRLFGSRFQLASLFATTSKGDSVGADVTRPFYSLSTPYAMGAGWTRIIDEDILYQGAEEYSKFLERSQTAQLAYGLKLEPDSFFIQRAEGGWFSSKHQFSQTEDTKTGTLPAYRELSGPTVGYSWVRPAYVEETYINAMERVEDFNMGNELRALAGFMSVKTGSDRDRWIFNVSNQDGVRLAPGRFILGQVGMTGRTAAGQWDNALLYANLNLFWRTDWPLLSTWVSHLEANKGRSLDGENQVILGGDNGLRGYRNNSFTGSQAVLWNVENRVFFPGEYFHLLRLGAAVFFDAGAVAPQGAGISFKRFKSDVGAGLRLASTRSRSGTVFRMDFAYALNDGPGSKRFVVAIRGGQAFELFTSSSRRLRTTPSSRLNAMTPPAFPVLQ